MLKELVSMAHLSYECMYSVVQIKRSNNVIEPTALKDKHLEISLFTQERPFYCMMVYTSWFTFI